MVHPDFDQQPSKNPFDKYPVIAPWVTWPTTMAARAEGVAGYVPQNVR
jgi:hypothetical protein